jgi:hypothetical protein
MSVAIRSRPPKLEEKPDSAAFCNSSTIMLGDSSSPSILDVSLSSNAETIPFLSLEDGRLGEHDTDLGNGITEIMPEL